MVLNSISFSCRVVPDRTWGAITSQIINILKVTIFFKLQPDEMDKIICLFIHTVYNCFHNSIMQHWPEGSYFYIITGWVNTIGEKEYNNKTVKIHPE